MESPCSASPLSPAPFPLENIVGTNTPCLQPVHVLFMDIVGYGRLRMAAQGGVQIELQKIVQETKEVRLAQQQNAGLIAHPSGDGILIHANRHAGAFGLIIRPTGDGMALVFFHDILSPLRCAIEITNILALRGDTIKTQTGGQIKLRMGIHSGPVLMVEDLNGQADVAGDGIVVAQRVMDCGDAGHILLSADAAKAIEKLDPWARYLTDLGTCRVKHEIKIHLYNLCGRTIGSPANFGNVSVPTKVFADTAARRRESVEREARTNRREAEEGLRPYVRSLVMMLCALCFTGCIAMGFALRSPKTLRDFLHYYTERSFGSGRPPQTLVETGVGGGTLPPPNPTGYQAQGGTRDFGGKELKTSPKPPPLPVRDGVPDFSGMTFWEARTAGKADGLVVKESKFSGYTDAKDAGLIYRQEPIAGSNFRRNRTVLVAVSKGASAESGDHTPAEPVTSTTSAPQPSAPPPGALPPAPAAERYTGIIIDAHHLPGMKAYQFAKVLNEGVTLYPDDDGADMHFHFCTSLSEAKKQISSLNPLVINAQSVVAPNGIDYSVCLSASDTKKWNEAAAYLDLNNNHKVGIILPPK